jgi:Lrp/AsnC family leucine-responsive transcriptional regulator
MLLRGEVQRVKPNYRGLRVRSGRAWVTLNGRDLVLKRGEEVTLELRHDAVVVSVRTSAAGHRAAGQSPTPDTTRARRVHAMAAQLDDIDRQYRSAQREARMTNAAIAAEVSNSSLSVRAHSEVGAARVIWLHGQLDPAALGKTMTAFIRVTAAFDEKYDAGIAAISRDADVLECYGVAGEDCLVIKTVVGDPSELNALLHRIRGQLTVQHSVTMIAFRP